MTTNATTGTIEARLARLERSARRWRAATLGLGLLVAAGVAVGAKAGGGRGEVSEVVRAHRLELVDAAGNVRVAGDATTRPTVELYNADGKRAVLVAAEPSRSFVLVGRDDDRDGRISMTSGDGDGGVLYLGSHGTDVMVQAAGDAVRAEAFRDGRVVWRASGGPPTP